MNTSNHNMNKVDSNLPQSASTHVTVFYDLLVFNMNIND